MGKSILGVGGESFSGYVSYCNGLTRLPPEVSEMIGILLPLTAGLIGYLLARNFVARRLRFVDAAQSVLAPLLAGLFAALVALPLALLPAVTVSSAVLFGIGAALGTASARRIIRRADAELRRLTP